MQVYSTAFKDGEDIPTRHTGFGEDVSPELIIEDAPSGTVTYAVVLDDLDVPFAKEFTHWIIWNIPAAGRIPEKLPAGGDISAPISARQGRAWGKNVYRGPKQPVFIRNEHRYVFTVYALDGMLGLPCSADKRKLLSAMSGHVLAKAQITGKYRRR